MLNEIQETKIKNVYNIVKSIENKHNSKEKRTLNDIKLCYTDNYILSLWKSEQEDWSSFEEFLIDIIEQNIIYN